MEINNITINQNHLEIKYILGNYKTLDNYPTERDVLYYIIEHLFLNKKDSITMNQLNKEFKEIIIYPHLESLQNDGFIQIKSNKIVLIKNPYSYGNE